MATRTSQTTLCGCATAHNGSGARLAIGVDAEGQRRNVIRLKRIEGQVRGLQQMVQDGRYCADILVQVSSVHEALRSVAKELMRNHLKYCAATAIREGDARAEAMYDELVELMHRHSR